MRQRFEVRGGGHGPWGISIPPGWILVEAIDPLTQRSKLWFVRAGESA